jgi:hypothetical protein
MKRATDIANTYGLVIGSQAAQQTKEFSYQLNILNVIFDAVKVQVGNELLPTIVSLAGTLGQFAGTVLPYVMGSVKAFITVFEGLALSVKLAGDAIVGTLYAIGDMVAAVAKAVVAIVHGDYQGAWDAMKEGYADVKNDMKATGEAAVADAQKTADRLEQLRMPKGGAAGAAGPGKGTKSFQSPDKEKKDKKDPSEMAEWRDELEQKKMDEKAYFDYSTEQEIAFWESKKKLATKNNNDLFQINHAIYELQKKDAQQAISDQQKDIETELALAERSTASKKKQLDAKYQLGEISASEQIKQELKLEDELYAAQQEQFARWRKLEEQKPQITQQVEDQIQKITEKHNEQVAQLHTKEALETKKTFDSITAPIQSALDTSVKGMIMGTTTLQKAVANLGQSIVASFVDMGAKMVMNWLKNEAMKLNISEAYTAMKVALGLEEATEKKVVEVAAAEESIATQAAVAAAGAAASQADIPYVGPELAVIAAAETYAMVMGYAVAATAAGGYDIPTGINPITQLHSEEMVLPADLANNIRNMSGGGGGGDTFNIQALDTKSFFSREGRKVIKSLAGSARRMGARV